MTVNYKLVMFSKARIQLNKEVQKHPKLLDNLEGHPADEFEMRIAEVAAYCNVLLDGDYTQEDLDDLSIVLTDKLVALRAPMSNIILPTTH